MDEQIILSKLSRVNVVKRFDTAAPDMPGQVTVLFFGVGIGLVWGRIFNIFLSLHGNRFGRERAGVSFFSFFFAGSRVPT